MSDLRSKRTDLLIFQALERMLNKHSFSDITVNEIAKESLVHRNTIYHHFDDKYDLLHHFILFGLGNVAKKVDVSGFSQHPFHIIHKIYESRYRDLFDLQKNDDQFMQVFSSSFVEMFVKDMNDADNIWAMGGISAILTWNNLNGNVFNMFQDYELLDRIYATKEFPKLN